MNNVQTLNLARKWRSSNFDQIVGQDLSVRMLKNSLYVGHIFPVYLFAGQRGCGKTSTARIFAAALNCHNLPLFKKQPKDTPIPCLVCASCIAMQKGAHPDFIEIDAASHTGVDNVRSIIEASTLMPLMGEKKIYLIDEAHMLSKAAFNAFLKILEEPPVSVVFILATTDSEKIIETVRSRCFQLFFRPIKNDELITHLQTICLAETINHDRAGLELIVKESQGSARDALNLLEQVRFASSAVTAISVSQVLGHVDDRALLHLLQAVLCSSSRTVVQALGKISYQESSLDFIWHRLIELARTVLWTKYGITKDLVTPYDAEIHALAQRCSSQLLQSFLLTMHKEYATFAKTTAQHTFFEMICLQFSRVSDDSDDSNGSSSSSGMAGHLQAPSPLLVPMDEADEQDEEGDDENEDQDEGSLDSWAQFMTQVSSTVTNPLLLTVLQRASLQSPVGDASEVTLVFPKDMQFFADVLKNHTADIEALLHKAYGRQLNVKSMFEELPRATAPRKEAIVAKKAEPSRVEIVSRVSTAARPEVPKPFVPKQQGSWGNTQQKRVDPYHNEASIDITDKNSWKKAHQLLEFFPGTITEIREYTNEQQQA